MTFNPFARLTERLLLLHLIISESFELPVDKVLWFFNKIRFLHEMSYLEHYKGINAGVRYRDRAFELLCTANKHLSVVSAQINAGTEVDGQDAEGITPMHVASEHGCIDTIKYFLHRNAAVNATNERQVTSFLVACKHEQWKATKILLDIDADPFLSDEENNTPFSATRDKVGKILMVHMLEKNNVGRETIK